MKIPVKRGNTLLLPFTALKDGLPVDLTGWTLVYLVKEGRWDDDDAAVLRFTTTLTDGLQIVTTPEGLALGGFSLSATSAKMRLPRARYWGALQGTPPTGGPIEFPNSGPQDEWLLESDGVFATA